MIKTDQGLSGIAKSLKSALTDAPLCKLVLVTTHITKKYMDGTSGKRARHITKYM